MIIILMNKDLIRKAIVRSKKNHFDKKTLLLEKKLLEKQIKQKLLETLKIVEKEIIIIVIKNNNFPLETKIENFLTGYEIKTKLNQSKINLKLTNQKKYFKIHSVFTKTFFTHQIFIFSKVIGEKLFLEYSFGNKKNNVEIENIFEEQLFEKNVDEKLELIKKEIINYYKKIDLSLK